MALDKQEVSMVFTEGVDTKTDNKIATKLSVLENGFIGQNGTIQKRNGYEELEKTIVNAAEYDSTTPIGEGELLFVNKNQIGILNNDTVAIYNSQNPQPWYIPNAQTLNTELSIEAVDFPQMSGTARGLQAVAGPNDIVMCGNYILPSGEYATSIIRKNYTDGSIIADAQVEFDSGIEDSGRLVLVGNKVYWAFKASIATIINFYDVTAYSTSPYALTQVAIDAKAGTSYDVFVENNIMFLIYTNTGNKLKIIAYNSTLTVLGIFINSTETLTIIGSPSISWSPPLNAYAVFYLSLDTGTGTSYANAFTLSTSYGIVGSVISSLIGITADFESNASSIFNSKAGYVDFFYTREASTWVVSYTGTTFNPSYGVTGTLAAHVFSIDEGIYIPLMVQSGEIRRVVLIDERKLPVATLSSDIPVVQIVGLGRYSSIIGIPLGVSQYGSSLVNLRLNNFKGSSPREVQDSTFISCGGGFCFDGATYSEAGFITAPVYYSATFSAGAGAVPAGTYRYAITYSYVDLSGNEYESAPAYSQDVIVPSPKTVRISTDITFSKRSREKNSANLYRRDTDGIFKLVSTKTFTDLASTQILEDNKASVSGQKTLYTTGGILENDPPPPSNIFTTHGDRVFCVNEERPVEVYFSKKLQQGEGIHFSSFFYFSVNENKNSSYERITGLGSIDDKFIVFKNNSIYAVFGDGPNAQGVGSFSDPKLVSTDVGCRDARSIVSTSEGLMFMSSKGIYLLSRTLEVDYIGADAEAYNSLEITSAVLLPKLNQVRFTTRTGVSLVYSYFYKQWAWFNNYEAQHSVIWKGVVTHLKSNGGVRPETSGFLDIFDPITIRIAISWLKANGVQNLQRIYMAQMIGTYKSPHQIEAKISYDYEDYVWETKYIIPLASGYNAVVKPSLTSIYNGGNNGTYDYDLRLSRQKCEALKIEIRDLDQLGESFTLTGMSIIIGVKKGLNKLTNNKQF